LAKVAEAAEVSKATLFKQFPTKAALFDAIVTESWKVEDEGDLRPPTGDLRAGLTAIGHRYVALLTRPGMAPSSASSSPSCRASPSWASPLRARQDALPRLGTPLSRHRDALGAAKLDDTELAATQFLGMISNYVFWPRMLLMNWSPDDASMAHVVDEAVLMMEARYGVANTSDQTDRHSDLVGLDANLNAHGTVAHAGRGRACFTWQRPIS
jgi:AcrR family transcriptional regulator